MGYADSAWNFLTSPYVPAGMQGPTPPPTQAQLNSYFGDPGNNPWVAMGPPRSAMAIPPASSVNGGMTDDQAAQLAGALKEKEKRDAMAGGGTAPAVGAMVAPAGPVSAWTAMAGGGPSLGVGGGVKAPAPAASNATGRQGVQDILGQMDQATLKSLQDQGLTVDQIKQRLSDLQGKALPENYQPLGALYDAWHPGSHLAQNLAPTETPQQRQEMISKLQDAVLKGEQGMSQDQLGMLKTKLQTMWHEDDVQARNQQHAESMAAQASYRDALLQNNQNKFNVGEYDKATKGLNSDKGFSDAMTHRDEITNFKSLLGQAETNPIAANLVPIAEIRQFVNRVSTVELNNATGSRDAADRVEQNLKTLMGGGTLTHENAMFMSKLSDAMEKQNNKNLLDHVEQHAQTYLTTKPPGVNSLEDAANAISGNLYGKVRAATGPTDAEVTAAKKWLADPANAKDPMRAQVQALVQ